MPLAPIARARKFERREAYHSGKEPGYACWVSFFPGEKGQWYLSCDEVSRPDLPLPKMSRDRFYAFSLPVGMDKSQFLIEMVLLESWDGMRSWEVISREPIRHQHAAHSFAQARTRDGRFLRFVWKYFSLDENAHPGEIFSISNDDGKTWQWQSAFHDKRFASAPHRLRTLRDGTLVLALPFLPVFSADRPRACTDLNALGTMRMNLCFSHDQGISWTTPLPIYGLQNVSETDFVELPSGDLLCVNNRMFPIPGRQIIYRTAQGIVPGAFEKSLTPELVPETVCMTEDGLLVGCHRGGGARSKYYVSDDLGMSWQPVEGIPAYENMERDMYQPWIQYLGNGRIACAGHYGFDEPILNKPYEQYVVVHLFDLEILNRTRNTAIAVRREYDKARGLWPNVYTLSLTCDGQPLPGKELEFWYAERYTPEYDDPGRLSLEERTKIGGTVIRVRTGMDGKARVSLPHLDRITDMHHNIRFVVRFNEDRSDQEFKPAKSPQYEMYSLLRQDPPLEPRERKAT